MNYSAFSSDDQDLEDWIRQQAESAPLDDLASPSGMQPSAAFQMPAHAEMAPLKIDNGPDWTDALGVGTSALAALADLGLNHGRGTGQILSSAGAFGQARGEQRLKQTQDALSYEEKRAALDRQNKYNDYLYANMAQRGQHQAVTAGQADERIDTGKRVAATKEAYSNRADAKVGRDTVADSDYADTFRNMLYDSGEVPRGKYDGVPYEQMKADQPAAGRMFEYLHAGDKAKATRGGTIAADLDAAPDTTAVAVDRAGKIAAETAPYKVQTAEDSAAARERGQQRGKEQNASDDSIPGLMAIDDQAATRAKADPTTFRKLQDVGGSFGTARDALKTMGDLRRQYGTELPGSAKTQFDIAQTAVNSALSELGATKTLSDNERQYYMSMIPNLSVGWTDALRPGGTDIKQQQLDGALTEFTSLANGKLRAYGHALDDGSRPPPPSAAPAGGPRRFANPADSMDGLIPPEANADPSGLSTTPGAPAPRFPGSGPASAGPSSSPDTVMMRSTNGIVGPVPRDKVQTAISKGWKMAQ